LKNYFVYILSNKSRMLYVGVTNNLEVRLYQHRMRLVQGFAERFGIFKLVYFEDTPDVMAAITREKEIKGWVRRKKVALISSFNPAWKDFSEEWSPPPADTLHSVQGDKQSWDS
jgi:putative endonuclease